MVDLKYIGLTTNAVMGQPAFVLATEQDIKEKVKSECKSVEGEEVERVDCCGFG